MKLILVRHGKAGKNFDLTDDASRCLTDIGINELENSMPNLKALVADAKSIRLWSSPLLRAVQSAKIIAVALEIKETNIYNFIGTGDFDSLVKELSLTAVDCLIIVGHQPYLGDWCQAICGHDVPFKKGAAVEITLSSLSPLTGTIERPAVSKIVKILIDYLQAIQTALNKFLAQPDEIENLHQLRVSIRKFRSLLSFFRPLVIHEDFQIHQDKMRKASQLLSYLRELDVLQSEWRNLSSKGIVKNTGSLSIFLQEERDKENVKLQRRLAEGFLASELLELECWFNESIVFQALKSLKSYVSHRALNWQRKIYSELKTIENSDLPKLHLLRIKCKKLRYIQEIFFGEKSNKHHTEKIADLKELQDKLGLLCDNSRNIEIISNLFSTNQSPGIADEKNFFISYLAGKEDGLKHLFN